MKIQTQPGLGNGLGEFREHLRSVWKSFSEDMKYTYQLRYLQVILGTDIAEEFP